MKAGNTVEQIELLKGLRDCSKRELKKNLENMKKLQKRIDSSVSSIDSLNVLIDETLSNVLKNQSK